MFHWSNLAIKCSKKKIPVFFFCLGNSFKIFIYLCFRSGKVSLLKLFWWRPFEAIPLLSPPAPPRPPCHQVFRRCLGSLLLCRFSSSSSSTRLGGMHCHLLTRVRLTPVTIHLRSSGLPTHKHVNWALTQYQIPFMCRATMWLLPF